MAGNSRFGSPSSPKLAFAGAESKHIVVLGLNLLIIIVLACFCTPGIRHEPSPSAAPTTYYVAKDGNDSANGLAPSFQGGSVGPFLTLNRAADIVKAGDVVEIRAGVYQEASTWSASGTPAHPITITNYQDDVVIIDGNNHAVPGGEYDVLFRIKGSWYKVNNLEVRYSSGYGLEVTSTGEHCTIDNCYAHHNWRSGITMSGSYGLLDNCRVYYNSMIYEWGMGAPSAWASGIAVCRTPSYVTVRNCTAWNNWGQGIDNYESYHVTVEDCVAYDNMVNFYISDTKYCLFQRNLSYCTPNNLVGQYVRAMQVPILMGDETRNPPSSDNTVVNNLVLGGDRNISIGRGIFENCLVANNTFVNASDRAGSEACNVRIGAGSYTNARFLNNIILQDGAVNIAINDASGVTLGYNTWSKAPPGSCQGTQDIVADPELARVGPTGPGLLTPGWFKILESSPARNRATVLGEVTEDFFKTPRGSAPDMGAYEIPPR